jgi:DNA-binding MarR family transcriptional regulator
MTGYDDDWLAFEELRDGADADGLLHPRRRGSASASPWKPTFTSVHAAYHQLSRRLEQLLRDVGIGLSATEAVVLVAAARDPGAAVALSRRETGIHPSTMTSVLDRLERSGLIERRRGTDDHRFVAILPTSQGRYAADLARTALRELDVELGVHLHSDDLAAVDGLAGAALVIGPRGTLPDY